MFPPLDIQRSREIKIKGPSGEIDVIPGQITPDGPVGPKEIVNGPSGSQVLDTGSDVTGHQQGASVNAAATKKPSAVVWEKNVHGKLGARVADLAPMMDPTWYSSSRGWESKRTLIAVHTGWRTRR